MKKKIENEKEIKGLFGYNTSFGERAGIQAEEKRGLEREALIDTLPDQTREEVLSREKGILPSGKKASPGRPKSKDADDYIRMTFIVNKDQLKKIRFISWKEGISTKEIIYKSLAEYLDDYEFKYGQIDLAK